MCVDAAVNNHEDALPSLIIDVVNLSEQVSSDKNDVALLGISALFPSTTAKPLRKGIGHGCFGISLKTIGGIIVDIVEQ